MLQTRPIQLDLYYTRRIVESNDYICIEHLMIKFALTMMMNLNTNMNSNLTQMCSLVRVCIGHGLSCTKLYLVIPGTECSQTHLFLIPGNDSKFSYDLIKFYNSQEQD